MFKTLGACILWLASSQAFAAGPVIGPDYGEEQIRAFTVAGVHPEMTADEAAAALKEAGYEGAFGKFAGTERNASVWVQVDRKAAPFRYVAQDGRVRVFEMIFEQHFDRPQSIQALKDMVVAKYGLPTEAAVYAEQGTLTYHAHFTVDHLGLRSWCTTDNSQICPETQRATLERESDLPILVVTLTPTTLHADIRDDASLKEGEAASKAAADAAREGKALSNTKSTKLGL